MGNEWLLIKGAVWIVGLGIAIRIVWELFHFGYIGLLNEVERLTMALVRSQRV